VWTLWSEHQIDYIINQHYTGIVHGWYTYAYGQVYILRVHRHLVVPINHIMNSYKVYIYKYIYILGQQEYPKYIYIYVRILYYTYVQKNISQVW
jgi:hypothetical protein